MEQLTFLSVAYSQPPEPQPSRKNKDAVTAIPGLHYIEDYINQDLHDWLLTRIDEHKWLDDLKRRVKNYGFKYDYRARKVNLDMHIGELPEWLKVLSKKLQKEGYTPEVADQVIGDEYSAQDKGFRVTLIVNPVLSIRLSP